MAKKTLQEKIHRAFFEDCPEWLIRKTFQEIANEYNRLLYKNDILEKENEKLRKELEEKKWMN